MKQWRRKAVVLVRDREVDGLRIRFKVRKTLRPDPNTLDLYVYNLGAERRAELSEQSIPVVLMAGHEGDAATIFAGLSRAVDHRREAPDWGTRIQAGDGDRAFRAFSSFSFGPGTKVADVLARIAKDLRVDAGDAIAKIKRGDFGGALDTYLQGYTATGRTVRELDRVVKALGLEWSIQDGQLQVLEPDGASQEEALVLGADSGLIGSPEHRLPDKAGGVPILQVKCLLNGRILPGRLVKLETTARTGLYRVESVEHAGDTHGPDWSTSWEGRPI